MALTGQGPVGKLSGQAASHFLVLVPCWVCLARAGRWFNAIDERGLPAHCIADHWSDWNSSYSTHTKVGVESTYLGMGNSCMKC